MKKMNKRVLKKIRKLFGLADKNPQKADRYVEIARKTGMRNQTSVPNDLKKRFCKKCGAHLTPGRNCTVRTKDGRLIYTCKKCGGISRYPYKGAKTYKTPQK
jgi:ribonuclease P protein subunit RPR2